MIRHLLRLTWNRKRSTLLLLLELFVTFLVVALVSTTAIYQAANWHRPLGFDPTGVLVARIDYQRSSDDFFEPAEAEGFARLLQEVRSLPEVESAAGCHVVPFDLSAMESQFEHDGERFDSSLNEVTDDFERVMGLEIGGWLGDHIVVSGYVVTPAVGFVRPGFELTLDRTEVESVFEVPLAYALDASNYVARERTFAGRTFRGHDLPFEGRNIWGATAVMLGSLRRALGFA